MLDRKGGKQQGACKQQDLALNLENKAEGRGHVRYQLSIPHSVAEAAILQGLIIRQSER